MLRRRRFWVIVAVLMALPLIALAVVVFTLPTIDALHTRSRVPSSKILDSRGRLLYEIIDPRSNEAGRHTPLTIDRIPAHLRRATIAVEDASFYVNPGVDVIGIARALWINVKGGEALAGGSTITQQLARMVLLDTEERQQRTLLRKLRESLLAWQIARRYSKDEVLALYLNESYYGNLAYGVEAAAQSYFGKGASELNLAEAALLAGLPQSPLAYDPFNDTTLAKKRQLIVLELMLKSGAISEDEWIAARQAQLKLAPAPYAIRAPHFVSYVRHMLERQFGVERILQGGLTVTTTLDLALNDAAQAIVGAHLSELSQASADAPARNANNAAVLALDPRSGAIRAMVGSPDYFDASISGAVNATVALRQPGSAIKPVTYAAALAQLPGFNAATPIIDARTVFPTKEGLPYVPVNYDRRNHGIISVREALATSNNVAAVKVLQRVGIKRMLALGNALGLRSFGAADDYGLSVTLGGGEVRLLELTAAFGAFANAGACVEPYALAEVRDAAGVLLYRRQPPPAQRVLDPRIAWLLSDILSDNAARAPAFGESSVLRLNRPAAVKTGTTTDFRDNWTVGYTSQLAVGVWVGNADGSPMQSVSGVTGAGPIWHDVMELAHRGLPVLAFEQPAGLQSIEVCALSGMLPSAECTFRKREWFLAGTAPVTADTWYRREAGRTVLDVPAEARNWAAAQGWPLARAAEAAPDAAVTTTPQLTVTLVQPDNGAVLRIDASMPATVQRIPIEVVVSLPDAQTVDVVLDQRTRVARFERSGGRTFWTLQPGEHRFVVRVTLADGRVFESAPTRVTVLR